MSTARTLRAQANSAHRADADNYVPTTKPVGALTANMVGCAGTPGYNETEHILPMSIGINGDISGTIDSNYAKGCGSAAYAERDVVGTLSDGAHQGGGLTAKMPIPDAYSPCVANPLTARMGKGINTTLDEGQTPIVCQGEGCDEL